MKINLYKTTLTLSILLLAAESPVFSKPKPKPEPKQNEITVCNHDVKDAKGIEIHATDGRINHTFQVPETKGDCHPPHPLFPNPANLTWTIVKGQLKQECKKESIVKDTSKATVTVSQTAAGELPYACQVSWK